MASVTNKLSDEEMIFSKRGDCMLVPGETMAGILSLLSEGNLKSVVRRNHDLVQELKEWVEIYVPCRHAIHLHKKDLLTLLHILARRRIVKPVQTVERVVLTRQRYEKRFVKLCDYIAAVIAQTYLERGEEAELADDEALIIIRDILCAFDETIILRNASKRKLAKWFIDGAKYAF